MSPKSTSPRRRRKPLRPLGQLAATEAELQRLRRNTQTQKSSNPPEDLDWVASTRTDNFGASQPLFNLFEGLRNVALCGSGIHFPPSLSFPPTAKNANPPTADRPLFVISSPTSDAANANVPRHSPTNLVPLFPSLPLSHFISLFQRGRRASWSAAAPPPTTPSSKLYPISSTRPSSPRYVGLLCHVRNGKRSPGGRFLLDLS